MGKETILEWLQGRLWVYSLLGAIYYQGPKEELLSNLANEDGLKEFAHHIANPLMEQGISQLYQELNDRQGDQNYPVELWEDYNRLFIGPGALLAPPWESVYRSKERLVFGEETLQVRDFYQRFGLEVKNLNKEPDDHIGLEMEFIAYLCQEAIQKIQDNEDAVPYIQATRQFLQEHLAQWVPEFCGDIEEGARTGFFRGLAKFTRGWLEFDGEAVAECLEAMDGM